MTDQLTGAALDEAVARAMGKTVIDAEHLSHGSLSLHVGQLMRRDPRSVRGLVDHENRPWEPSSAYALLPELEAWVRDRELTAIEKFGLGLNATHTAKLYARNMNQAWRGKGRSRPEALSRAIVAAAGGE